MVSSANASRTDGAVFDAAEGGEAIPERVEGHAAGHLEQRPVLADPGERALRDKRTGNAGHDDLAHDRPRGQNARPAGQRPDSIKPNAAREVRIDLVGQRGVVAHQGITGERLQRDDDALGVSGVTTRSCPNAARHLACTCPRISAVSGKTVPVCAM